jgi:glycerol-3-phosphate dehydrogenase
VEDAELVVIAVPSRSFSAVVHDLPGTSAVLSLTKGLDPSTGGRLTGPERTATGRFLTSAVVLRGDDGGGRETLRDLRRDLTYTRKVVELIACWSSTARSADAVRKVGTVEGPTTAPILDDLATTLGIDLPITRAVREVLDGRNVRMCSPSS